MTESNRQLSPFEQTFEQLPTTLPIFPLPNALLVPGGKLPLNIFETRYLNMINDALRGDRLVGMVQPRPEPKNIKDAATPSVFEIGCAGRIIDYSETQDGRIEIVLNGICRFSITEEVSSIRGYRMVLPDWDPFKNDYLADKEPAKATVEIFINALRSFLDGHDMPADWELFEKLSTNDLVNSLMNVLPIETGERQILLESSSLDTRIRTFTAILAGTVSDSQTRH
ncbi:LON peptidase substrate-binding domain-containing protein [Arenicella sp. 4NH20-0111]|uniref:LON peptidase substrate-binding domain-containing protein n=1 Tax=Arenicella sp. 4NH20-0111 TaxID=3127648 RepID=UPI00310AA901